MENSPLQIFIPKQFEVLSLVPPPPLHGRIPTHAILDVTVDDEIEFRVGEAVMSRQHWVDLGDDGIDPLNLIITLKCRDSIF